MSYIIPKIMPDLLQRTANTPATSPGFTRTAGGFFPAAIVSSTTRAITPSKPLSALMSSYEYRLDVE